MVKNGSYGDRASHRHLKDRARARLDELQAMLSGLQSARKDGTAGDAAVLEGQVHRMLVDWKAELTGPSPTCSLGPDVSLDIHRLLQLCGEEGEDGAMIRLAELPPPVDLKPEPVEVVEPHLVVGGSAAATAFLGNYCMPREFQEPEFLGSDNFKSTHATGLHHAFMNCIEGPTHLDYQQVNLHQKLQHNMLHGFDTSGQNGVDLVTQNSDLIPVTNPPPSAFLRPKCALWDCPRPSQGSEWWQDYCSSFHATLAFNEGPPGTVPVLRPGGIDLKDGPLFAALSARTQGKNVGIPECEGAATAKSPWNAPELFDLSVLSGESLREWLFFDKPRKAFESGSRKQRSLPDYNGRGWHESRKQVMKEFGGLKRSYYMDPQPLRHYEWHLYEYEIIKCDAWALYRLELKLVDPKKGTKGKVSRDSLDDLQQQMGKLSSENYVDSKRCLKTRVKVNRNKISENTYSASNVVDQKENPPLDQMISATESLVYGPSLPYGYSLENLSEYYGT